MQLHASRILRHWTILVLVLAMGLVSAACGASDTDDGDDGAAMAEGMVEAPEGMSLQVEAEADPVGGINIRLVTEEFTFTPENAGAEDVAGEGHAHLFVNGEKAGRIYGEWFHLGRQPAGEHELRVELSANSHAVYARDGEPIESIVTVEVPEQAGHMHGDLEPHPTESMAVDAELIPDTIVGYAVRISTEGFTFTPEDVNGEHVDGEGHAHIYVDGERRGRIYTEWWHLTGLEAGTREVRIELNGNDHAPYEVDGEPVEVVVTVDVPEELAGRSGAHGHGHGHDHGHGDEKDNGHGGMDAAAPEVMDPDAVMFSASVVGGVVEGGVETWQVTEGDTVTATITSDVDDEIHVHGIDIYADLPAGEPVTVSFEASLTGRFEIETHGTDTLIAMLQVNPA